MSLVVISICLRFSVNSEIRLTMDIAKIKDLATLFLASYIHQLFIFFLIKKGCISSRYHVVVYYFISTTYPHDQFDLYIESS